MPELADRARQLVGRLLAERRAELEALVDAELERVVDELVAERLVARNGASAATGGPRPPADTTAPAARLCSSCGEREAAKGRRVCYRCRERERRARAASADGEGPRPAPDTQDG